MRMTLSDLTAVLLKPNLKINPVKVRWLQDNAPEGYSFMQCILLAYAEHKAYTRPNEDWYKVARGKLGVSEEDYQLINNHIKAGV